MGYAMKIDRGDSGSFAEREGGKRISGGRLICEEKAIVVCSGRSADERPFDKLRVTGWGETKATTGAVAHNTIKNTTPALHRSAATTGRQKDTVLGAPWNQGKHCIDLATGDTVQ